MLILLRTFTDRLIGLSAFIGAAALVLVVAVVVVDVVGRYFRAPLYGAQDIVQMAAVFIVFGGMAYCDRRGGHVTVDLLEGRFPPRLNHWLTILGNVAGAVVFALIAIQVWDASKLARLLKMSTNILYLPRAPFQYAIVGFSALTALSMAIRALELAVKRRPEPRKEPS